MEDKVTKVKASTYDQLKVKAEAEGISMAEAAKRLIEESARPPNSCELRHFRQALESRGLSPPKRTDWVWAMTDVLPADLLEGTKLEPYADARREAELRCRLGDELYVLVVQEGLTIEEAVEKASAEAEPAAEPVTE